MPDIINFIKIINNYILHNNELISALVGSLIGGGLTVIASFVATKQTHSYNLKIAKKQEAGLVNLLKNSLYTELSNLKLLLQKEFKEHLESDEEIFYGTCVISQDYFTVYHSNSILIGKLTDDVRNKVISVYILAKYFIDAIKGNTENVRIFDRYNELNSACVSNNENERITIFKTATKEYNSLKHYKTKVLSPAYHQLINEINELLPLLSSNK